LLAACLPRGVPCRPRRAGGGGHRSGGIPGSRALARPVRPAASFRAVAAPHRGQPGNRPRSGANPAAGSGARRAPRRAGRGIAARPLDRGGAANSLARAPCRDRPALPPRVHAWRDRPAARPAARHRQLEAAARPRCAGGGHAVKRELEHVEIPDEHDARERAWQLVSAAFAERVPAPPSRPRRLVPVVALAVAGAIVAAAASSPGRAVLHAIRSTVGVEKAQPALFSLPTSGRLLVASGGGVWVVQDDGSKRRLGSYASASWSPHGRYVVATRRNALYALTPTGEERWSLARPAVLFPRWAGTKTDTRIAYLTTSRLHVVGGDGRGDLDAGGLPAGARIAPAWRPDKGFVLAYANTHGRVYAYDTVHCADFWSPDGRWLLIGLPEADQWVFVRADGRKITAVSNVSSQFRSQPFPRVEGWAP